MVFVRLRKDAMPIVQGNAFGMFYGTIILFAYACVAGGKFSFDFSPGYIFSLFYLSLFGSVIAFGCYLTLVGRIGADRAGIGLIAEEDRLRIHDLRGPSELFLSRDGCRDSEPREGQTRESQAHEDQANQQSLGDSHVHLPGRVGREYFSCWMLQMPIRLAHEHAGHREGD